MPPPPPGVGRPRTPQRDEPRQYVGFPVPVSVKTGLEAAAKSKGRSLSAEGAARLAQSLAWDGEIFFEEPRQLIARKLHGHYTIGGVGAVVRLLLSLEDPHSFLEPDEAERTRRRQAMVEMLLAYVETDAERQTAFYSWLAENARVVAARQAGIHPK